MREDTREGAREALTGEAAGEVLSSEIVSNRNADLVGQGGRQHVTESDKASLVTIPRSR